MGAERNLLFGVVALQAGLITSDDFVKACAIWATRKGTTLGDVLVELGALHAKGVTLMRREKDDTPAP